MFKKVKKPITNKQTLIFVLLLNSMKRVLAVLGVLGMLWSYVPWNHIHAQFSDVGNEISESFDIETVTEELPNFEVSNVPVEYEDISKRTETTKTFRKIDGTYEVAMYDVVIHYLENGEWEQVDNSLNDLGNEFENTFNKFKIKFPKKIDDNNQIKLSIDKYSIDWRILNIDTSGINYDDTEITPNNIKELVNVNQSVLYSDIQPNVDIEYIITGDSVKENIILNQYVENFSLTFEYRLKDLSLVQDGEGNILFIDGLNETIFTFSELFMIDDNGEVSFGVDYKLEETGNKTYEITITPNNNWLLDAVYPVIIDPTLNSNNTSMLIYDTYISEANPTTNYYSLDEMKISDVHYTNEYRGLLYFYLPTSIMDKVITYGGLKLNKYNGTNGSEINLYKNTELFSSASVTWETWVTGSKKYEDRVIDYHSVDDGNEYIFDITKAIKEWQLTGSNRTTGFTIGVDGNYGAINSVYQNHSSSGTFRPVIEIGYVESSGLTESWTYHSQNAGFAGVGYTNDYTGNLTFIHNVYTGNHELYPINLNFVFDNQLKGENVGLGLGWRTNYNMTAFWDDNVDMVQILDGDGSVNHFRSLTCSDIPGYYNHPSYSCYIAEDGSNQVVQRDNYTNKLRYDSPNHFGYTFNSNGKLERIYDLKNNLDITIEYHESYSHKISKLTDGAGNYIIFNYGSDGSLNLQYLYVYNLGSVTEKIYPNYTSNTLTNIKHEYDYDQNSTFSEGNYIDFVYELGKLKEINTFKDQNKTIQASNKISYTYDPQNRVNSVSSSINSELLDKMDISYELGSTTFLFNDFIAVDYIDEVCFYKYYQYASFTGANSSTGSICLYIENTPYTDMRDPYSYSFRTYYRNPDLTTSVFPTTSLDGYAFKTDGNLGETFIKEARGFVNSESITSNTNQGKVRYTFDYYGHTVNIIDDNGNAQFYEYANIFRGVSSPEQANYMMNNKLLKASEPQKSSFGDQEGSFVENRTNLVQNGSFDSGLSNWNYSGAYTSTLVSDEFYDNVLGGNGVGFNSDSDFRTALWLETGNIAATTSTALLVAVLLTSTSIVIPLAVVVLLVVCSSIAADYAFNKVVDSIYD